MKYIELQDLNEDEIKVLDNKEIAEAILDLQEVKVEKIHQAKKVKILEYAIFELAKEVAKKKEEKAKKETKNKKSK